MNPISREPVLTSVLASVLVWLGAKYAVKVDPQQASEAAGVVLLVAGAFARQLVRPVAKDPQVPTLMPYVEAPPVPTEPRGRLENYVPPPPDPGKPSRGR